MMVVAAPGYLPELQPAQQQQQQDRPPLQRHVWHVN